MILITPINKTISPKINECIYIAAPIAVIPQAVALKTGHGLGSTK
jgi:hypothetical protein